MNSITGALHCRTEPVRYEMKHGIASDEMIDILVRGPQEAHASFAGARRFSAGAWILLCSSAYLLECVCVFVCVCVRMHA